jgi:hypothetical protein
MVYFGLIKKEKAQKIKDKIFFWRKKNKELK